MKHCVDILQSESKPDRYYSGMCKNVARRLTKHNSSKSLHSSKYRPWCLVFYCWFDDASKAAAFERYLKSGSGRAFSNKRLR